MSNSMIYKYKVGKKWFTFDKSLLQPEDLQIFDKADWTDKLKIITIYKDLKENEDDTINVLSFKKENANKDKRKIEYANKKEKLMNNIKELNAKEQTKKTTDEIEKLQKELKDLEIEYADVINVHTANTLNVSNVNTLNLNNIDKIKTSIQETEKKFEEVKNLLSDEDINKFKTLFENLKETNIEEIKNIIKDIKPNELPEELKQDIKNIKEQIAKLGNDVSDLSTFIKEKKLNSIIDTLKNVNPNDISDELYEEIENGFNLSEVMEFYETYIAKDMVYYSTGKNQYYKLTFEILNARFSPFEISNVKSGANQKTIKTFYYEEDGVKYEFEEIPDNFYLINTDIKTDTTKTISYPLFEILHSIYINHKKASGFLGLKTNKEAKKEQKQINDKLDEVFKTLRELSNKVAAQQTDMNEMKKEIDVLRMQQHPAQQNSRGERVETKPSIVNQELQNVRATLSRDAQASRKPNQQPQQKQKTFEDSLKEIMNIRRKDIEPDDYTDDSDEWLANGFEDEVIEVDENVGVVPIAGAVSNKIKLAGSLLEELKEDLKNYGLALNFNIYKKRRQQPKPEKQASKTGNGIVEAKKINDSITKSTDYTDLKELYEDLYE